MGKEFELEKLTGNDNFHTWSFAMQNVIDYKGYSKCIQWVERIEKDVTIRECAESDVTKLLACRALIVLSVEKNIFDHIKQCKTAIEVWEKLASLYEGSGISRKIAILRDMLTYKLENTGGMQSYIDEIISGANKLKGIDFQITDEWIGAILLAGLTENFAPLTMAIEATTNEIKSDIIISKLLDAQHNQPSSSNGSSFFSKNKNVNGQKAQQKCKNCKRQNHATKDCRDPKNCFSCGKNGHGKKDCKSQKSDSYVLQIH